MAINVYAIGHLALIDKTFTDVDGAPIDPTDNSLFVTDPDGLTTEYVYNTAGTKRATEEDIQRAVREPRRVQIAPGNTILLIQSGAMYPDGPMVAKLSKHFSVVPFTGLADEPAPREARVHEHTTRNIAIISDPDKPANIVPLSTSARDTYQTPLPKRDSGAYSRTRASPQHAQEPPR